MYDTFIRIILIILILSWLISNGNIIRCPNALEIDSEFVFIMIELYCDCG